MSTQKKFCSECGTPVQGAKFCPQCGVATGIVQAPASSAAAEPPSVPAATTPSPVVPREPVAAKPVVPQAAASTEAFKDPLASILSGGDDDDDSTDDTLGMPRKDDEPAKKGLPVGMIAMGGLALVLAGIVGFIASDEERSAAVQCKLLGHKDKCITEADRLAEVEKREKEEENALMGHHYGSFDLNFDPPDDTWVTIVQKRYEEPRADFVKRVSAAGPDTRTLKDRKIGDYTQGKSADGQTKGSIAFVTEAAWNARHPEGTPPPAPLPPKPPVPGEPIPPPLPPPVYPKGPVTWRPTEGKKLLLPMTLANLPLLEKEQCAPVSADKPDECVRLTPERAKQIEERRQSPKRNAEGDLIPDPTTKIKTTDISTWTYEIELAAPHYKTRRVFFYEQPAPPDVDLKKLEAEGWTVRKFKRAPDGKFVIDNASFDLMPEPRMVAVPKYIQLLKELHCLRQTADYKGKSDQGKKDAEDLLWEQKAFSKEVRAIAELNDQDPEFIAYRDAVMKTYQCPKLEP